MVAIREYMAQQWPRYVVGFFGSYGLLDAIYILATFDYSVLKNPPTGGDLVALIALLVLACSSLILNSVVFYAAARKSVAATKISLVFYCIGVVLFGITVLFLMAFIIGGVIPREMWGQIGGEIVLTAILEAVYGWSLLVLLRDARGQARDKWGGLLNYRNGELESAGPIRL
ncbi:hypothetical protein BGX26_007143 [Mortierella sp. AD094]|nr:hypothetical protein BGX26_007143 [Mortierella sp. AD094]